MTTKEMDRPSVGALHIYVILYYSKKKGQQEEANLVTLDSP